VKKTSTILSVLLAGNFLISSCASSYKPIRPETVSYDYTSTTVDSNLTTSFAYDVLTLRDNKKYAKKEVKSNLRVVSVKVVNNTSAPIHLGKDCRLLMGEREIIPLDPTIASKKLNQGVPIYLLYSLLFLNITKQSGDGYSSKTSTTSIPIGLPIAAGNMMVASTANKIMRAELTGHNILNKTVGPGETAFGLLCLTESVTGKLKFEIIRPN
jgi:hypothetical protein